MSIIFLLMKFIIIFLWLLCGEAAVYFWEDQKLARKFVTKEVKSLLKNNQIYKILFILSGPLGLICILIKRWFLTKG